MFRTGKDRQGVSLPGTEAKLIVNPSRILYNEKKRHQVRKEEAGKGEDWALSLPHQLSAAETLLPPSLQTAGHSAVPRPEPHPGDCLSSQG